MTRADAPRRTSCRSRQSFRRTTGTSPPRRPWRLPPAQNSAREWREISRNDFLPVSHAELPVQRARRALRARRARRARRRSETRARRGGRTGRRDEHGLDDEAVGGVVVALAVVRDQRVALLVRRPGVALRPGPLRSQPARHPADSGSLVGGFIARVCASRPSDRDSHAGAARVQGDEAHRRACAQAGRDASGHASRQAGRLASCQAVCANSHLPK